MPDTKRQSETSIVLAWCGRLILRILGWRIEGDIPDLPKFVIVGAPHTSNMDGFLFVFMAWSLRIRVYWMMKSSLFVGPLGWLFRSLNSLPIDRSGAHQIVDQMVEAFAQRDRMILLLTPEGTRKRAPYWRTGFYHIAYNAGVPIVLGYVDYGRKVGSLGKIFVPTGDIEADFAIIRDFYRGVQARYPENFGDIRPRPREDAQ